MMKRVRLLTKAVSVVAASFMAQKRHSVVVSQLTEQPPRKHHAGGLIPLGNSKESREDDEPAHYKNTMGCLSRWSTLNF